ncbi:glutamine synthetase [Streptomyces venezuelae ATCC 10712]|nr:glutamine synthetase [Streptomyces venezuelae ATCC 10712]
MWAVPGPPSVATDTQQQPHGRRSQVLVSAGAEVPSASRHFLRNKKQEWEEYRSEVTAFELRKNLPVL